MDFFDFMFIFSHIVVIGLFTFTFLSFYISEKKHRKKCIDEIVKECDISIDLANDMMNCVKQSNSGSLDPYMRLSDGTRFNIRTGKIGIVVRSFGPLKDYEDGEEDYEYYDVFWKCKEIVRKIK